MSAKVSPGHLSDEAKDRLVAGYSDEQLAENHRHASEHPDTDWARTLAAEVARRAALTATEDKS